MLAVRVTHTTEGCRMSEDLQYSEDASHPTTQDIIVEEPESLDDCNAPSPIPLGRVVKRVSFDRLHVREYPVILGDHPATTSGLPVTLDWNVSNSYQVEVNKYEQRSTRRRAGLELRMPPSVRREILHGTCADKELIHPEDMKRVTKEVKRIKVQRANTIAMQEFESLHVFFESAARKWRRWRNSWSEDVIEEPAAVWLKKWQAEKKGGPGIVSCSLRRSSSCSSIVKSRSRVGDASVSVPTRSSSMTTLSKMNAGIDASDSTRTTVNTAASEHATDLSVQSLSKSVQAQALEAHEGDGIILNIGDLTLSSCCSEEAALVLKECLP